jgi:hypothetical protein
VTAGYATVDPVFVLQANEVVPVEVKELRGPLIRCPIFLVKLQSHLAGILVTRVRIVNGYREKPFSTVLRGHSCAQIGGECRNATTAGKVVSDEGDSRRNG